MKIASWTSPFRSEKELESERGDAFARNNGTPLSFRLNSGEKATFERRRIFMYDSPNICERTCIHVGWKKT